jgi:signal transduction histidine kinase
MRFVSEYRELLKVPDPRFAEVQVSSALKAVVALLGEVLQPVAVRVRVHPESLSVQADRDLLDQVLVNLVKNAVDALAGVSEPTLALDGSLARGRVLIRVADNGVGIPETDIDQIFVPFFTTKRSGSGIGLSLSRQIMISHGGDMTVTSEPGSGTQVSLRF